MTERCIARITIGKVDKRMHTFTKFTEVKKYVTQKYMIENKETHWNFYKMNEEELAKYVKWANSLLCKTQPKLKLKHLIEIRNKERKRLGLRKI